MASTYRQFESGLDLTQRIQQMSPLFLNALGETARILELTAFRTKVADQADQLNERQLKVLNRLIDYELRGGFEGGMNNAKYQEMPLFQTPTVRALDFSRKIEVKTQ